MAETSQPWDGSSYPASTDDDMNAAKYFDGVVQDNLNLLAVAGTSSPVTVNTGWAWVNGKLYKNTASINVAVPTPVSATRIDRIVLRADYTAKTVTVQRLAGSEGGAAPAVTQTDGTTWEYSLAQVSITTGGVITVTPEATLAEPRGAHKKRDIMFKGASVSGHYPIQDETGAVDYRWHLANGDTENGVVTPNLSDRFILAAGSTYAAGATGGAATKNLEHAHAQTVHAHAQTVHLHAQTVHAHAQTVHLHAQTVHAHGAGTLATEGHEHSGATGGVNTGNLILHLSEIGAQEFAQAHAHQIPWQSGLGITGSTGSSAAVNTGNSAAVNTGDSAAVNTGNSAAVNTGDSAAVNTGNGGSTTQDIMPPYYALAAFVYVGD